MLNLSLPVLECSRRQNSDPEAEGDVVAVEQIVTRRECLAAD